MNIIKGTAICVLFFAAVSMNSTIAQANVKQIKAYKEAYPDAKPKCTGCHTAAVPKKDEGMHDLNDYGKKAAGIKTEPDAAAYTTAGSIESQENAK